MPNHKNDCHCVICQLVAEGLSQEEAIAEWDRIEAEKMEQYGWIVHFVDELMPHSNAINIHTHGLESFDHLNFQIVLSLPPQVAHNILHTLVDRVKAGEKFEADQVVDGVIRKPFQIKLVAAKEHDRDVLRIIFPDPSGKLEFEEMSDPNYLEQYIELHTLKKNFIAYKP